MRLAVPSLLPAERRRSREINIERGKSAEEERTGDIVWTLDYWLKAIDPELLQYSNLFKEHHFDTEKTILLLTPEDVTEMGIKGGHRRLLVDFIVNHNKLGGSPLTRQKSAPLPHKPQVVGGQSLAAKLAHGYMSASVSAPDVAQDSQAGSSTGRMRSDTMTTGISKSKLTLRKSFIQNDKISAEMYAQLGQAIPPNEELLNWFAACYKGGNGKSSKSGKLYVTKRYLAFAPAKKVIPLDDIRTVERKGPSEVVIGTSKKELTFVLMGSQDELIDALNYLTLTANNIAAKDAIMKNDLNQFQKVVKARSNTKVPPGTEGMKNHVRQENMNLIEAVRSGHLQIIPSLLSDEYIDINATDRQHYTALHCALTEAVADESILLLLLGQDNIRLDMKNNDGNTAFHYFCACYPFPDCKKVAETMIQKGADINAQNLQGESPLHKATKNSSIRLLMVQLLLDAKVKINVQTNLGETPLHYSVRLGREDLMRILLLAGADPLIRGKNSESLLQIAERENPALVGALSPVVRVCEIVRKEGLMMFELALVKEEIAEPSVFSRIDEDFCDKIGATNRIYREKLLRLAQACATPRSRAIKLQNELKSLPHVPEGGIVFINTKEVEFVEKIGFGACGKVWKALYKENIVAVKELKVPEGGNVSILKREVQIMAATKTPYTVDFYGCIVEPKISIVMEFCKRKSLQHVLSEDKIFTWDMFFSFSEQCVKGVRSLHSHDPPIYHRDMKSPNLLVTEDWKIKICDFGLAVFNVLKNEETLKHTRGTVAYMCPESFDGGLFTTKSDIYSVGIILWEMIYRIVHGAYKRPYEEIEYDFQIISKVQNDQLRPEIPPTLPKSLTSLVEACWSQKAEARPSCDQLLEQLATIHQEYQSNIDQWNTLCK